MNSARLEDIALYHWAPSRSRKGIMRRGLEPGHWSTDRMWKPPYVAYAESPQLAWILSAGQSHRLRHPDSWDLWLTGMDDVVRLHKGAEALMFDGGEDRVKEWRVYGRMPKSTLWFVGTRMLDGEKSVT